MEGRQSVPGAGFQVQKPLPFDLREHQPADHGKHARERLVIGQVSVCIGCCCGQTDRGKPAVPVEWLKTEWRRRGLLKNIQLTISGCLGPCDVPNVVLIARAEENVWLGNIDRFEYYREIVEWAAESKAAGRMLPLSRNLLKHRLDPFRQVDRDLALGSPV